MYTFVISMIISAIACLIIFKKDFWAKRYLILLIGTVVAFVAILSTNFSIKNSLDTKVVTNWTKPIQKMNLVDSLFVSDSVIVAKNNLDIDDYFCEDTIEVPNIKQNYFIYTHKEKLRIVYTEDDGDGGYVESYYLSDIYIIPSESDTIAYIIKKTKYYDPNSKWVAGFSLPKIETIKCLCIPPTEYDKIPKLYLKDVPF